MSTTERVGGAGRAAFRIHLGLKSIGVDSIDIVARGTGAAPSIDLPSRLYQKYGSRLRSVLDTLPASLQRSHDGRMFSTGLLPDWTDHRIRAIDPDLVHLHWINAGFLGIDSVATIDAPLVWTLHDMWPFTGGCHYSGGCRRFTEACGDCPALGGSCERDLSRLIWRRKSDLWDELDLTVVAPSTWLADEARASSLFGDVDIRVIPNGIDTTIHRPYDPVRSRELLDFTADRELIVFGSADPNDPRKGVRFLFDALRTVADWDSAVEVVIFGSDQLDLPSDFGLPIHEVGKVDEVELRLLYSAADVFVTPAVEDNLPNTVMESMAAATPVVAFDVGGIGDMVDHKVTGYLADRGDSADLADGIKWTLERNREDESMGSRSRETVLDRFDVEDVARKYRNLYTNIINL